MVIAKSTKATNVLKTLEEEVSSGQDKANNQAKMPTIISMETRPNQKPAVASGFAKSPTKSKAVIKIGKAHRGNE